MALEYRDITGRYLNIDYTPKRGYIEFTPTAPQVSAGEAILPLHTVQMNVDPQGYISGRLARTDSPGVLPTGWLWSVEEKVENGNMWYLAVTDGVGPLDIIASYTPGLVPPAIQIQGSPGPAGDDGPPGIPAYLYWQPEEPTVDSPHIYPEFWLDTDDDSADQGTGGGGTGDLTEEDANTFYLRKDGVSTDPPQIVTGNVTLETDDPDNKPNPDLIVKGDTALATLFVEFGVDVNNTNINNVATPTVGHQAANRDFVLAQSGNPNIHVGLTPPATPTVGHTWIELATT